MSKNHLEEVLKILAI